MTSKAFVRGASIPYVVWMAIFVIVPLLFIVGYAFTNADGSFTLENFSNLGVYASVFKNSFLQAAIATIICLLIGYPFAYILSHERPSVQKAAMLLIMLPMWVNFLLRTYAWMSILENNGFLNQFFRAIGLIDYLNSIGVLSTNYIPMINTSFAVVLGMIYNYLPFMIMPIYTVISGIDRRLIEAAQDLGANRIQTFTRLILPLSLPGVLSGVMMVFIPSVSTFAISRLLGGGLHWLLGDVIDMQFLGGTYNPHLGSAISLIMMIVVLLCMGIMNRFGEGEDEAVML
ncbi:MAG: ABC transporter permease [Clostridiales bacterium]|nr:ABC transporter permease [bacterium 210917-SL.2.15]MCI5844113.1 ABC transporter permease [Clostridiales bacterium]MDY4035962.1 ABC transporter permease [Candidatus Pseudoscilispira sp.]